MNNTCEDELKKISFGNHQKLWLHETIPFIHSLLKQQREDIESEITKAKIEENKEWLKSLNKPDVDDIIGTWEIEQRISELEKGLK